MQPTTKNQTTPLMLAAGTGSDETVFFLLSLGANPDKTNGEGDTALIYAIESRCITTINLLVPVTQVDLGGAIGYLAKDQVQLTTEVLRQLLERAAQDKEAAIEGLIGAVKFGSNRIIKMFAENMSDRSIFIGPRSDHSLP